VTTDLIRGLYILGWVFKDIWLASILLLDYTIIKLMIVKVKIKTIK